MIKYALYRNKYYFYIPKCTNPVCYLLTRNQKDMLYLELLLDNLNSTPAANNGLYYLSSDQTKAFKTYLCIRENTVPDAIVSYTKDGVDYSSDLLKITEDLNFISLYLSIQKIHRNSISTREIPSTIKLFEKDAHSRLTDAYAEVLRQNNIQKPKIYYLPSPNNDNS